MLEIFDKLLPILTLIAGWLLNELSQSFGKRRECKENIGRAITDLLEIRHRIISIENLTKTLVDNYTLPSEAMPTVRQVFEQAIGQPDKISERYENAVNIIAGQHPTAAFKYSSGGQIPMLLNNLKAMFRDHGADPEQIYEVEGKLTEMLMPRINEIAIELGVMHSRKEAKKIKQIVMSTPEIPEELDKYIDDIKKGN